MNAKSRFLMVKLGELGRKVEEALVERKIGRGDFPDARSGHLPVARPAPNGVQFSRVGRTDP